METLIKRFSRLFRGLDRAYGSLDLTTKDARGKQKGKYRFVHEPRTTATYDSHLKGEVSIGVVPINEDDACRWGAIDVDQYPLDHGEVLKSISRIKVPLVVCRSKSGGAHLYLFLKGPVEAEKVQTALKEVAAELGFGGCEIFPKQIKLVLERGDHGNFLNLPYFDHEGGLRYAFNQDGSAATLEQFLDLAEASAVSEDQLGSLLSKSTPLLDDKIKDGPPCLQALLRQGFPEGTRNNGLFNLGVYLR